jgi:putative hydrolase
LRAAVEATGLEPEGRTPVRCSAVNRGQWLNATFDDLIPYFFEMLDALSEGENPEDAQAVEAALKLHAGGAAGLLGVGIGLTFGQLTTRALGTYELAVPRPALPRSDPAHELMVMSQNLAAFAEQWEVSPAEVERWACLTDAVVHLALSGPPLRHRVIALMGDYMTNFGLDSKLLQAAMAGRVRGKVDPDALMASIQTPMQARPAAELRAISAVLFAHSMRIAEGGAEGFPPLSSRLAEAVRRRRAEMPLRDRLVEFWFGLILGPAEERRGERFISAIVERVGETALRRLWIADESVPRPEDLDDPERWLRRLGG